MTEPGDKQAAQSVLIPSPEAVRGTDVPFAQRHVHLMEFLPLVTEAKERERRDKKSKRRENE
jgi:hypothetical protein